MLESGVIAGSVWLLWVGSTQALASLLGRAVPLGSINRQIVGPQHRRGYLLPVAIVFTGVVAAWSQIIILAGLAASRDAGTFLIYALALLASAGWAITLLLAGRTSRPES
jgi:hypothetical protein